MKAKIKVIALLIVMAIVFGVVAPLTNITLAATAPKQIGKTGVYYDGDILEKFGYELSGTSNTVTLLHPTAFSNQIIDKNTELYKTILKEFENSEDEFGNTKGVNATFYFPLPDNTSYVEINYDGKSDISYSVVDENFKTNWDRL